MKFLYVSLLCFLLGIQCTVLNFNGRRDERRTHKLNDLDDMLKNNRMGRAKYMNDGVQTYLVLQLALSNDQLKDIKPFCRLPAIFRDTLEGSAKKLEAITALLAATLSDDYIVSWDLDIIVLLATAKKEQMFCAQYTHKTNSELVGSDIIHLISQTETHLVLVKKSIKQYKEW
jgi:hypothetical protein